MHLERSAVLAAAFLLLATPALAGNSVPAPILGAGLPGLAFLGLVGVGYLLVKGRRRD